MHSPTYQIVSHLKIPLLSDQQGQLSPQKREHRWLPRLIHPNIVKLKEVTCVAVGTRSRLNDSAPFIFF